MPYTTVRAVSSLPVAGAKVALSVGLPVKNKLSIILIWSSILANKLQKYRFPAPDLW